MDSNVPTQPAESGDLEACLVGFVVGPRPRFAASLFAKRSFARRCWGVWACCRVNFMIRFDLIESD